MIKYIITALSLLSVLSVSAQEKTQTIDSKIVHVTVFQNSAQVVREAATDLPAGQTTFILKDVSPYLAPNSLQVKASGNFTVLSVNQKTDFTTNTEENEEIRQLRERIKQVKDSIEEVNMEIGILREEESFLITNKPVGGNNESLNAENLKNIFEFYSTKISSIRNELLQKERKLIRLREKLTQLNQQLAQLRGKNKLPSQEVHITVRADSPTKAGLEVSYLVESAGWYPSYDIRVDKLDEPVSMIYKANVYQNTGIDWNNVKLSFSNATPDRSGNVPELSTWYLNFAEPLRIRGMNSLKKEAPAPEIMEEAIAFDNDDAEIAEVVVNQNITGFSFDVEIPYDIKTGGEEKSIDMQRLKLPAEFRHKAVPRAEEAAFLLAGIHDWEQFNLMNGEANLYFENTFVGSSYINPGFTKDTLNLSLGRDQGIIVKREKRKEYTGERFLGNNRIETRSWEISLRNTKQQPVEIIVLDQVPVSANKEIEVDIEELSSGNLNELTGIVQWNLRIPAGESKKLILTYRVKYPEGKELWIE